VPPVKFTPIKHKFLHKPTGVEAEIESNYNEVLGALTALRYNSYEAKDGADFAEKQVPDGSTEDKIISALGYFNDKIPV
jgi:hypothetical protein